MVTGFVLNPCRKIERTLDVSNAHVDDLRNDVPLPSAIVKTTMCCCIDCPSLGSRTKFRFKWHAKPHTVHNPIFQHGTCFSKYWVDHTTKNKAVTRGSHIHQRQRWQLWFPISGTRFQDPNHPFLSIGCTTVFNLSLATSLQHLGTRMCHARVFRNMFEETYSHCLCLILAVKSANMQCPCNVWKKWKNALQVILIWVCSRLLSYMFSFSDWFFLCTAEYV